MKEKARKAVIITAGVLITTVMLTVILYYYNDKVRRDNAWIYSAEDKSSDYGSYSEQKADINKVDLATLMQVKGIGRKTAHDIIDYREKHGKFTGMWQLKEINSVNNEVYLILCEQFTVVSDSDNYYYKESYGVAKVNLNTASVNELMSVEGITKQIAENIILRRRDHGDYTSVRELLDTDGITITLYNEIHDKFIV